ncbi:MAG TPA: response regulator [Patescibacteria group bacterium]|nr:response regulator [Patescibacteria group bacterium]
MAKTVLVVDDDGLIRHSLVNFLSQGDIKVIEASNGKEALEKLEDNDVNLVVTDLRMPVMDGMQMVQELRKTAKGKDLRVIILSTDEETASVNAAMKAGVTTYLSKSALDLGTIAKQIMEALG